MSHDPTGDQLPCVLSTPLNNNKSPRRSARLQEQRNRENGNNDDANDSDDNMNNNDLPDLEHEEEKNENIDNFRSLKASFDKMMNEMRKQNRLLTQRVTSMQNQQKDLTDQIKEQQKELNDKIMADQRATLVPGLSFEEMNELRQKENTDIYATLSRPLRSIKEDCPSTIFHKILGLKSESFKFDKATDTIDYFRRFDNFCDNIGSKDDNGEYKSGVPAMVRHFYITTSYLSDPIQQRYYQASDEGEAVNDYQGIKTWLYKIQKGKYNIEKRKTALLNWKYNHERLEDAINDFIAKISRYILEIKFATKHGVSQNDIVRIDEKELFKHFLNHISGEERKHVYAAFQAIGGQYNISKLKLLCKAVDKQLRPGLGIKSIIKTKASHEINAIQGQVEDNHDQCQNCDCENQHDIYAINGRYNNHRRNNFRFRPRRRPHFRRKPRKWCRICRNNSHWTSQCRRNNNERRNNRYKSFVDKSRRLQCNHCKGPHVESRCWKKYPEQKKEYLKKKEQMKRRYPNATPADIFALEEEFGYSEEESTWTNTEEQLYDRILAIEKGTTSKVMNSETPAEQAKIEEDHQQLEADLAEYMSSEEDQMEQEHDINCIEDDYGYRPRHD